MSVSLSGLRALSAHRLENVLRYWFGTRQSASPSDKFIKAIVNDLVRIKDDDPSDADPVLRWQGLSLSRSKQTAVLLPEIDDPKYVEGHLVPLTTLELAELKQPSLANTESTHFVSSNKPLLAYELEHGAGSLRVQQLQAQGIRLQVGQRLAIRKRVGGEKLKFEHHRSLKNIFQESGVPAVLRDHVPLLYLDDNLVGIAAINPIGPVMCIVPAYRAGSGEQGWVVEWNL